MWRVVITIQYGKNRHTGYSFFVCINVAKFAISVWRFSPHCAVKFTIVYSTNYKRVWKSIVWELLLYSVYYHRHSKTIDKCGKNPQSARRKPNYHTKCGRNCHKILSVQKKNKRLKNILNKSYGPSNKRSEKSKNLIQKALRSF